jgi:hypothetical protein
MYEMMLDSSHLIFVRSCHWCLSLSYFLLKKLRCSSLMILKSQVGKLCCGRKFDQVERWQTLKTCSSQQPWKHVD